MEHEWFKLYDDAVKYYTYYLCKKCGQKIWTGKTGKKYLVCKPPAIWYHSYLAPLDCDEAIMRAALE